MDMRHVIELLKRADLHDEAAAVGLVMQQRAELLEALKKCRFDSLNMSLDDWRFVQAAITRAEAAE